MSLIEVAIAISILAFSCGGILGASILSRRIAEDAINANNAATIVESYMEQLKSMTLSKMANQDTHEIAQLSASFSLPTKTDTADDPLLTSIGTPPALASLTPGQTPSGVVDNLKCVRNQNSDAVGTATTWSAAWPNATSYPATTPTTGDFYLNVWVWITDLTGTGTNATEVYGITMIYTWQSRDGGKVRYGMDEIRSIRSRVPTY